MKYSRNSKTNTCYTYIEESLLSMCDTEEDSLSEIRRYANEFPNEIDYNIAQYGNLLVYYDDVRDFYNDCDMKCVKKMSDSAIWELYKRQVGYVARELIKT